MNPALGTTGIQFGKDMIPAPKIRYDQIFFYAPTQRHRDHREKQSLRVLCGFVRDFFGGAVGMVIFRYFILVISA